MRMAEIDLFHKWQTESFGAHGAKGTHIGPHAVLYTDALLSDMKIPATRVEGWVFDPVRVASDWFRPMFPALYGKIVLDVRDRKIAATQGSADNNGSGSGGHGWLRVFTYMIHWLHQFFAHLFR